MKMQFQILTHEPANGNSIIIHMARIIESNLSAETNYLNWINNENSNTADRKREEKKIVQLAL